MSQRRRHSLDIHSVSLGVILMALFITRLMLTTRGHFHLQDELRYRYSFVFIREIVNLNPIEAVRQMFAFPLFARPLLVLANLPTAFLQVLFLLLTGIKTETPISLTIPSLFQALVTVGIAWLFYRLCIRYLGSRLWSLIAMVIYSLLINTNLYIRHILPYDSALFIYLGLLLWVVESAKKASWKLPSLAGLGVAILHLVYPGYYLFGVVVGGLTTWLPGKRWLGRGLLFAGPMVVMLAIMELVSRALGTSYLETARFVVGRVVVGSPNETLIFLYRYLWQVEGLIGQVLVIGFTVFLVHFAIWWRRYPSEFRLLTLGMVGSYLLHGLSGPIFGKVFYGRSVRMFFWFVVLGVIMLVRRSLNHNRAQYVVAVGLVVVSVVSFSHWYPRLVNLYYPGDVMFSRIGPDYAQKVSQVNENYPPDSKENHPVMNASYLAVNFGRIFFPTHEQYKYETQNGELIFQSPHPLNFVAYQFEALSPEERRLIQDRNYQMKLYRLSQD